MKKVFLINPCKRLAKYQNKVCVQNELVFYILNSANFPKPRSVENFLKITFFYDNRLNIDQKNESKTLKTILSNLKESVRIYMSISVTLNIFQ